MFYSITDRFSKFHSVSLGSSKTDFVLVFVNIVLPVATGINIRDIIGIGTNSVVATIYHNNK